MNQGVTRESDCFSYDGSQLVTIGGECVVV